MTVNCIFVRKTWNRYRKELKAKYIPRRWGIVACFLLAFVTGFHEYGVVSVIDAIFLNVLELNSVDAAPISMVVQGLPYLMFVFPFSYWMGHRFGHRVSFTLGLLAMYLYAIFSSIVCTWSHCTTAGATEFPALLLGLVLFFVSLSLMYYNMMLLCLDQIPEEGSDVRSTVLHWMQISFFSGEASAYVAIPFLFKYCGAFYGYVLVGSVALCAILFLMWSPMQLARSGHRGHPFKLICSVLFAAGKECCHGIKRSWDRRRRGNIIANEHLGQSRVAYSALMRKHKPNCFERVQEKYGGHLPSEDVCDVQQFCLICLMLLSFTSYHMVFAIMNIADLSQIERLTFPSFAVTATSHCSENYSEVLNFTVIHDVHIPVASMNTIHSLTSVLTLILFDRLINPLFGPYLRLRAKIGIGLLFSFASSVVAMSIEALRRESYSSATPTVVNNFAEIQQGVSTHWPAISISIFSTIPHLVLFGIANAIVQMGCKWLMTFESTTCFVLHVYVVFCVCL
jgi:hypothetical protein